MSQHPEADPSPQFLNTSHDPILSQQSADRFWIDVDGDSAENRESRRLEISEDLENMLVEFFKLLSEGTRLKVLLLLIRNEELNVSTLCEYLGQSQPAVSHHLALLRNAGLVEVRRQGKNNFYSVRKAHFLQLLQELFHSTRIDGQDEIQLGRLVLALSSD